MTEALGWPIESLCLVLKYDVKCLHCTHTFSLFILFFLVPLVIHLQDHESSSIPKQYKLTETSPRH